MYVIGDVINGAIPFLMLPILTKYLSPEDYGKISVFSVIVSIMSIFTGLSVHGAINVNYFKLEKKELQTFISNCIIILNVTTVIMILLLLLLYPILKDILEFEIHWLLLSVILASAQFLTTINLLLWMVEHKPIPYAFYQISQTIIITSLILYYILYLNYDWEGQIIGLAIGTLIFSISSIIFLLKRKYINFKFDLMYIKDALNFGVPLLPHALSGWIKTGSDRLIITALLGASLTGIYTVSYQVGAVMLVLVTGFSKAWSPYIMEKLSSNPSIEEKKNIVRLTYKYFVLLLLISFIYIFTSIKLLPLFIGKEFHGSIEYLAYFVFAFAFQGMYFMVGNYLFYTKSTKQLSKISVLTSLIHIILIFTLINFIGIKGVAITTLIVSIINFLLIWYMSNKLYPMPWNLWKQ